MHPDRTLLHGGLVLVGNDRFERVSILVEGTRIAALLPPGDTGPEDAPHRDIGDRIVIPGLVNGHTHSHGALGRGGVPDDATLESFLSGAAWLNANRNADDLALGARLAAAEMIRKGCTACFDLFVELPGPTVAGVHAVAQAYHNAGMRAVVAPMMADRTLYQALPGLLDAFEPALREAVAAISLPGWQDALAVCRAAFDAWPVPQDRVRLGLGPTIPLHCSDDFLIACAALSAGRDLPLQTHLAETRMQQIAARQRYGTTLTAHLDRLGVLSARFSGAHGVWLSPDEAGMLARHEAGIAHNPMSNLRLGSGIAPVAMLRAQGVTVGIGTDASNTSDGQNMFEALRLAATLSRARGEAPADWIKARDALVMATEGSARLLGLDRVGRIAPGWAADLLFLDAGYCHYTPLRDPVSQVVFAENGAALREVMIAGKLVFAGDRVLTLDEAALNRQAHDAAARLDAANSEARLMQRAAATVVQGFCHGQCATYSDNFH